MASKLTDITTSYHFFKPDQVLTAEQLNEFLNYFEDQDRLTRISLNGVGKVCGFKVSYASASPKRITITQGAGVTTDGDLLNLRKPGSDTPFKSIDLRDVRYTHFLPFIDEDAKYDKFLLNAGSQISLWEVFPSAEAGDSSQSPQPLDSFPGNLDDMVVMLYLECYDDEAEPCDGINCDNQGIQQVARLRVLLLSTTDAAAMLQNDEVFDKHELMSTYQQMKDLTVKRVLVTPSNTGKIADLVNSYSLSPEGQLLTDLKNGLKLMQTKITPYYPDNSLGAILTLIDQKLPAAAANPPVFFQYRHDFLKDIVDTYNELKELFVHLSSECCPSITAFPKHLMLGRLTPTSDDLLIGRYEHKWYETPVNASSHEFPHFESVMMRLYNQLNTYPLPPENKPQGGLLRTDVKITPSRYRAGMGNKAIPFYYDLTTSLLKYWNYEKTLVGKQRRNMSYNRTLLDPSADIQTPLAYNLEPYNFLEIEGHQGQDLQVAMEKISDIRDRYGLAFDLKAISIDIDNTIVIDTSNYECEFEDLAVLLTAWVKEQECNLSSVATILSAYSIKQPGYNKKEALYTPRTNQYMIAEGAATEYAGILKTSLADLGKQQTAEHKAVIEENRMMFSSNSSVLDSIVTDNDTVGYAFMRAVSENVRGSANDFIADGNYFALEITRQEGSLPWDPSDYVSIVDNTLQILSYSHVLSNSIPLTIAGITDKVIADYKKNIDNLCLVLKRIQVTHQTNRTLSDKNRAILASLIQTLNNICCASEQLKALLAEIDRRKDEILARLTLQKFCLEHPSLEHLGGVEPGGTFVLIYLNKGTNVQGAVSNAPTGTVVADFSLPYMCCSDCSPINFIMPRPVVKLTLPKNVFCIGTDTSPMQFQVQPVGGEIKADKTIPGLTITGDKLFIDPIIFPPASYNQIINFTVNDQLTDCQLTVVKPVVADFVVPQSPATNPVVNFQPIGSFPSGTKFQWNFGDGSSSDQQNVTHTYNLPVNPTNTVTVTLTVTPASGACPTIISHPITFQEIAIDIQPRVFCYADSGSYAFTVTPAGAAANIDGPGVDSNNTFTPGNSYVGEVPIFLNGSEVFTLTVNPSPTAIILLAEVRDQNVYLQCTTTNADSFEWAFTDSKGNRIHGEISNVQEPVIPLSEFEGIEPGAEIFVRLTAVNQCDQVIKNRTVSVPANSQSCVTNATEVLQLYYTELGAFVTSGDFDKMTGVQREIMSNAYNFFGLVNSDRASFISGTRNEEVFNALGTRIQETHREIQLLTEQPNPEQLSRMVWFYQLLVKMFLGIIQCQPEDNYKVTSVAALLQLIASHLNPDNPESFSKMGVAIDPDGMFAESVLRSRDFRALSTNSWEIINNLYFYLTQGGGSSTLKSAAPAPSGTAPALKTTELSGTPEKSTATAKTSTTKKKK